MTHTIDWPDQCPICGGDVTVETAHPQDDGPAAYDGDRWRCEDGHKGAVYVDEDGIAELVEPTHTELRSI